MRVHFYDAGQALAALVSLPDGRRVLVDAGESPLRDGCAGACADWHARVMKGLTLDLQGGRLDLAWFTHQHSDHLGGAPGVLRAFRPVTYVDNGLDLTKPTVRRAREAASAVSAVIHVVDPDHRTVPLVDGALVRFRAIVPSPWPARCHTDPNACSIGLRIDYCQSSVLFTGDAPREEEDALDLGGPVSLLQVAHHGAETSTSERFIKRAQPRYAVISSGRVDEGTNAGYCHPRATTVDTLNRALGEVGRRTVKAFDGQTRCGKDKPEHWGEVPTSDRLWLTSRDGDVALVTAGDGVFRREPPP